MYVEATTTEQQTTLSLERARLVRLCARLTCDAHAAEDLAQDALLVAWQQEHALRDPAKRARWLSGIARNLCLHWSRRRGLERHWAAQPRRHDDAASPPESELVAGDIDMVLTLERGELAELLGRALALLPPDTREVLVERYMHESVAHTDLAARLALSKAAVKKRAERGKAALNGVLATNLRPDALAYGLMRPATDAWQETRLWCPGCGRCKLEGRLRPTQGKLVLRCPGCSLPYTNYINAHWEDGLTNLRTFRPRPLASAYLSI